MDPCLTPPSSPSDLSSRLLTKRRCPFGESPHQQPKIAANCDNTGRLLPAARGLHKWYESPNIVDTGLSAFQIMMNSQRANSGLLASPTPIASSTSFAKCWVCQQDAETLPCTFCEHGVCEMCVRQCSKCFGVFCAFCSTINYEHYEDSALCLTCHAEEFRKLKSMAMTSQAQFGQSVVKEHFPQVMA